MNKKVKFTTRLLTFMLAVVLLAAALPSKPAQAAVMGIDVSKYQGIINWQQVKASGVNFAFIRIGSTQKGLDPYFAINMNGTISAGIKTGVYIYSYATNAIEAQAEAAFALAAIEPYPVSMPVVIDIENSVHKLLNPIQNADIVNNFCSVIDAAGYYPMVYSNKYLYTNKIAPVGWDMWVAQYGDSCDVPAAIWQATDKGRIGGIAGNVDIDYLYKDYSKLIVANGFVAKAQGLRYYENYKLVRNRFVQNGGFTYYIDANGFRILNCFYPVGDGVYYLDAEGRMQTGLFNVGADSCYAAPDGKLLTGFVDLGGQTFYFDPASFAMKKGFTQTDRGVCYFDENTGAQIKGIATIGNDIYYFDDITGVMKTGAIDFGGTVFTFDPATGKLVQ